MEQEDWTIEVVICPADEELIEHTIETEDLLHVHFQDEAVLSTADQKL